MIQWKLNQEYVCHDRPLWPRMVYALVMMVGSLCYSQALAQKQVFLAPHPDKLFYADSLHKAAKITGDRSTLAEAYYMYGKVYIGMGDLVSAMSWYLKSLKIQEELQDWAKVGRLYNRIAEVEARKGNDERSLYYIRKGIEMAKKAKSPFYLALVQGLLAQYLSEDGKAKLFANTTHKQRLDSAIYYTKENIKIGHSLHDSVLVITGEFNLARFQYQLDSNRVDFLKACHRAYKANKRLNNLSGLLFTTCALTYQYLEMGQYDQVGVWLAELQNLYNSSPANDYHIRIELNSLATLYYSKTGKWKQAYLHAVDLHQIQINQYIEDRNLALTKQSFYYEAEQDKVQLQAQARELDLQKQMMVILGVVASFITIMGVVFYRLYKKNQKLGQQNEYLLKEQSHRLMNELQSITSFLSLNAEKSSDSDSMSILQDSLLRIESVGLLHRKLYGSKSMGKVDVNDFLIELIDHVLIVFGKHEVQLDADMADMMIDSQLALSLGLIVNELATNSCKYAFVEEGDHRITIAIKSVTEGIQTELVLQYSDNGPGGGESSKVGFGTRLISMETTQLGGTYRISTEKGFRFTLKIPFNKKSISDPVVSV
ncbi:histidine kinase dimerization/phosphoacceptor domain -containing protein [Dyadobacter jejuensis]|nr:histidine kinase dimerization/phosphoacceptor domain -containing protein [Dyadobacter jejuensis]